MIVDAILETGKARRIHPGLAFEDKRPPVREDQPVPDEEHAALANGHAIVIGADQPGALRNQEQASRGAVIDVLGNLRGDLTWQVGANAGDQRGRDDGAGL